MLSLSTGYNYVGNLQLFEEIADESSFSDLEGLSVPFVQNRKELRVGTLFKGP